MTPKTRSDLARFVPPGGTMVELGVAAGNFACELIRANPDCIYEGVDRYSDHHDQREFLLATHKTSLARREVGGRGAIFWLATFEEQAPLYRDRTLDLVYIDGYAHTGQDGGRTLELFWPKVREGGILAGHDYHPKWRQTMEVVDDFVARHDLELHLIDEDPFPSWWVRNTEASRDEGGAQS
jgi:hypothetical protein